MQIMNREAFMNTERKIGYLLSGALLHTMSMLQVPRIPVTKNRGNPIFPYVAENISVCSLNKASPQRAGISIIRDKLSIFFLFLYSSTYGFM